MHFGRFVICFGLGALCTFLSVMFIPMIAIAPAKFAVLFTLGNLLALGSTFFLLGPCRQLRNMMKPHRLIASIVYVAAMIFTLVAALKLHSWPLTLVSIIVQMCALFWYCLSYIPFGRRIIGSCCGKLVGG